jgi:hypothetical protein
LALAGPAVDFQLPNYQITQLPNSHLGNPACLTTRTEFSVVVQFEFLQGKWKVLSDQPFTRAVDKIFILEKQSWCKMGADVDRDCVALEFSFASVGPELEETTGAIWQVS